MASLERKLRRVKQKEFVKNFMCTGCFRIPNTIEGEKIDDWHMENNNGKIKLTCPSCFGEIE